MHNPVMMVGIGEMAGVFARGLLRSGYPVYPVTRDMSVENAAAKMPEPELVVISVGESDIHQVLAEIPLAWRNRLVLLQNELLPRDWQAVELDHPTVISVWFEKKKGQEAKVLISSPIYGEHSKIIETALAKVDIPSHAVPTEADMAYELVRKNVYILTTNIAGLRTGGNVAELWRDHQSLAQAVASDVMDIQEYLVGHKVERERLIAGMLEAFDGDPQHNCMGRSAPVRLRRALSLADEAKLSVPSLRDIAAKHL